MIDLNQPTIPPDTLIRSITLADPFVTDRLGIALGRLLTAGDIVTLSGDLGAGKSALARAAIRAQLNDPNADVPSPTFTLIQTYETPTVEIWHVDLYRLADAADIEELGLYEAFTDAACLIEWPERLAGGVPDRALQISLVPAGEGRLATLFAPPEWHHRIEALLSDVE